MELRAGKAEEAEARVPSSQMTRMEWLQGGKKIRRGVEGE
jgi:hypothetical protein